MAHRVRPVSSTPPGRAPCLVSGSTRDLQNGLARPILVPPSNLHCHASSPALPAIGAGVSLGQPCCSLPFNRNARCWPERGGSATGSDTPLPIGF